MTDHMDRRNFLQATAGSMALAATAGCSSDGGDGGSSGGDATEETDAMEEGTDAMTEGTDAMGEETDAMDEETDAMDEEMTESGMMEPSDPAEAPRASIDRFSEDAGTLLVRNDENDLPGPDEAIDFDQGPFITTGFGPDGGTVEYYNFDVQPTSPAPIYAFFRENGDPVEDQLNVVGVTPGDDGYNDFWRVNKVTVPDDYQANTVTATHQLMDAGYEIEQTDTIKNCPIVPDGSTASKRAGDNDGELVEGWYDGEIVSYFLFAEDELSVAGDSVPLSPIYVSFNTNPGEDDGGPASGFMTEEGSDQTHNVLATLPGDYGYSPLWMVGVYDNADFDSVSDLDSATDANILDPNAAHVNCPVVSTE